MNPMNQQPAVNAFGTTETVDQKTGLLTSVPAWGSYLYQNFLLPAFSPNAASEWLNLNSPFASAVPANNLNTQATNTFGGLSTQPDYFSNNWSMPPPVKTERVEMPAPPVPPQPQPLQQPVAGPSYYSSFEYGSGIATSLLMNPSASSSSSTISPSVDQIDRRILVRSPSPIDRPSGSAHITPQRSPKLGQKRRASSMDSDMYHSHDEHDHEVPEGVERDGMIWGMKVDEYRALSARERKRVRNRISARTFRAKRKEHLSSLESTLSTKDLQVKLANEEAANLRREVAELRRRLAKYEAV